MGRYLFRLPDVGEGIAEAEIVNWHVAPGDVVAEDQPVADVMTDKATVEITSPVAGKVLSLGAALGTAMAIGGTLLEVEVDGAGNAATAPPQAPEKAPPAPSVAPVAAPAAPVPTSSPIASSTAIAVLRPPGARPLASPAIRRRAEEAGVRLAALRGSGPAGRILQADLDAYLAGGQAGAVTPAYGMREEVQEVPLIGLRRRIAEKMQEAKRRIPHFTYVEEIDVTELEALRLHLNATRSPAQAKLTLLPLLLRALVKILPRFPQMNARFDDEAGIIRRHGAVHAGIATQTPGGLMVPVLRHAEVLNVWELAAEISRLAAAARDGSAKREELSGSTITITSLGALGGLVHTPVINHPEVAIIGPNRIAERPVVREGRVEIRKMMNLSSSFDHRVVDGADAAEFIQAFKQCAEHPAMIFMD